MRSIASRAGLGILVLTAVACGKAGPPQPPVPRGPLPPAQVTVRQTGEIARVCFTVPEPRGAKPNQALAGSEVLRVTYAPGLQVPRDPQAFRVRSQTIGTPGPEDLVTGRRVCVDDAGLPALEGGPDGWTLRYAVRLRDRAGRPSSLIAAPDLVAVAPPSPPTGVRAEATADGTLLRWDAVTDPPEAHYLVYRAEGEGPFPEAPLTAPSIARPEFLDETAVVGKTYRYAVRVEAAAGLPVRESRSSAEVELVATDRFAPARPSGLVAVQERGSVRLFWNPNIERDLAGYRLERRRPGGEWVVLGTPVEPLFLDAEVVPGDRWEYRVLAFDRADPPNTSEPSEEATAEIVEDPTVGSEGERP